jgi:hypothetical protein
MKSSSASRLALLFSILIATLKKPSSDKSSPGKTTIIRKTAQKTHTTNTAKGMRNGIRFSPLSKA